MNKQQQPTSKGIDQSNEMVREWFTKAAEQGDRGAIKWLIKLDQREGKTPIYQVGQKVYLPMHWRERAPIGALTKYERDRNERLMEIASGRPWNIKKILNIGTPNPYHVLEQQDITDPFTDVTWTWNTIHDPPTKDVLDRGFQEYVNRVNAEKRARQEEKRARQEEKRQESFEQAVGFREFYRKSPNLEAWGKLRCETVEDCRKIIKKMFQFLEGYPTIRERLYKSLGHGRRWDTVSYSQLCKDCKTVEDCRKIIRDIFEFIGKGYPTIRERLYKSLKHGMRFRIKKSKRKSRKRRSVKRKASRKRKKKTVKELRAECKAQGLVYDPKTKKCRVSKRRSAKRKSRKVSRKRRSAKRKSRKVSRKRRSAKRKVSRKRRSAKRKVSRKRKSRKSSRKKVIGGKMRTIHKSKNPIPYDEDWAKGFVTHIGPGGGGGVNNYTGTKKVPTRRILDARKKLIDKIYFLHDQLVALDSSLVKDMFAVEILNPTEWRDPPQYMDRDDLKHYVKIMKADVKELLKANKKKSRKNKFRNGDGKPKKNPGKEPPTAYAHCWSPLPAKSKGFGKLDRECMRKVDAYRGKITLDYDSSKWGEPSSRYS